VTQGGEEMMKNDENLCEKSLLDDLSSNSYASVPGESLTDKPTMVCKISLRRLCGS
jgi:hypothetical protein